MNGQGNVSSFLDVRLKVSEFAHEVSAIPVNYRLRLLESAGRRIRGYEGAGDVQSPRVQSPRHRNQRVRRHKRWNHVASAKGGSSSGSLQGRPENVITAEFIIMRPLLLSLVRFLSFSVGYGGVIWAIIGGIAAVFGRNFFTAGWGWFFLAVGAASALAKR
jgi:hypothetical protein